MKVKYDYIITSDQTRANKEDTIGCLLTGLFLLVCLFIFLSVLPFLLILLGWLIVILALITIYKMYFEQAVLNFIQKHNLRR